MWTHVSRIHSGGLGSVPHYTKKVVHATSKERFSTTTKPNKFNKSPISKSSTPVIWMQHNKGDRWSVEWFTKGGKHHRRGNFKYDTAITFLNKKRKLNPNWIFKGVGR